MSAGSLVRRARPLLGTLVEIGASGPAAQQAIDAGFARMAALQSRLSRFEPGSLIGRFNALDAGDSIALDADADADGDARTVLSAAGQLLSWTEGGFDISLGSGPQAWSVSGGRLCKHAPGVQLDLGGIAKGHAVDAAVERLRALGCVAGWVNAGGDLRSFGAATLTLQLRDEASGGVRDWGRLQDGACATSHFAPGSRSRLSVTRAAGRGGPARHVSVLAPSCLWADALTKVAAQDPQHPVLRRCGAQVWLH